MIKHPFEHEFNHAVKQYHALINYDYLEKVDFSTLHSKYNDDFCIRLFKINKFTPGDNPDFFSYVFDALASTSISIGIILEKNPEELNFYIGFKYIPSMDISNQIFSQGFLSTFPCSRAQLLTPEASCKLLNRLFNCHNFSAITSVMNIPNKSATTTHSDSDDSKEHMRSTILQNLTTLFSSQVYTALFLAEPTCGHTKKDLVNELLILYNTLSQFTQSTNTLSTSTAQNTSCTYTTNQSESSCNTCTLTDNCSTSNSEASYNNISPSTTMTLPNCNRIVNLSTTFNCSTSSSENRGSSTANATNKTCANGSSEANLNATNTSDGCSFSYCKQNKMMSDSLADLAALISRLKLATSLFHFSAFFLSPLLATTIRAGYTYAGLATDTSTTIHSNRIYTWNDNDPIYPSLLNHLAHLALPYYKASPQSKSVTASSIITSEELFNVFYFPFSNHS